MNCSVCQDLFQQRLDGLEPADQTVLESHLRDCPSCRTLHAAALRFQQGLRLLVAPTPPEGLAARIAACLREDQQARQRWRRRLTTGLAAAAAVLLLLSARWWWPGGTLVELPQTDPDQQARDEHPKQPTGFVVPPLGGDGNRLKAELQTQTPAPGAFRESMAEVGSTMAQVAARTADMTVTESRHFLPLLSGSSLGNLQFPAAPVGTWSPQVGAWSPDHAPAAQVLREAGEGVSGTLAPVAESPRRALDLFLRELPPMNLDEKMGL